MRRPQMQAGSGMLLKSASLGAISRGSQVLAEKGRFRIQGSNRSNHDSIL